MPAPWKINEMSKGDFLISIKIFVKEVNILVETLGVSNLGNLRLTINPINALIEVRK